MVGRFGRRLFEHGPHPLAEMFLFLAALYVVHWGFYPLLFALMVSRYRRIVFITATYLFFALSLLGTFLVRSGVLTSVHAFATDPRRGIFIVRKTKTDRRDAKKLNKPEAGHFAKADPAYGAGVAVRLGLATQGSAAAE